MAVLDCHSRQDLKGLHVNAQALNAQALLTRPNRQALLEEVDHLLVRIELASAGPTRHGHVAAARNRIHTTVISCQSIGKTLVGPSQSRGPSLRRGEAAAEQRLSRAPASEKGRDLPRCQSSHMTTAWHRPSHTKSSTVAPPPDTSAAGCRAHCISPSRLGAGAGSSGCLVAWQPKVAC